MPRYNAALQGMSEYLKAVQERVVIFDGAVLECGDAAEATGM